MGKYIYFIYAWLFLAAFGTGTLIVNWHEIPKQGIESFPLLIGPAIIVFALTFLIVGIAIAIGKPRDFMPPSNSPLIIKMINVEKNYVYMTVASYDDQNATKQLYYQIPIKDIGGPGDMKAGMIVINHNGILELFKFN